MLKRHGLMRAFDELKGNRVIAVCAPAGYGKTVAVSQWIDNNPCAKGLFSIDEYDNDLAVFCESFCTALRLCQPKNQMLDDIISHQKLQSSPDIFALRAISVLSSRKQAIIVVDDLHLIHNSTVLNAFLIFIKRLPNNFQVILISRYELPLGLSDLWLKGQVARVSADQFLFTKKEIVALLKKRGLNITEEQAKNISEKTQGWAIGINAFLLSKGRSSDRVYDYLDEFVQTNIWEHWDESTREFMLRTANLKSLTPALCEELTGNSHSEEFLDDLVRRGAFVTRHKKDDYRYHDLFQQFLKRMAKERGDAFQCELADKEGHWHLSQGDFHSSVGCFIRCENYDGIAKCFEQLDYSNRPSLLASKLISIIRHPVVEASIRKHPHLLILLIWRAFADGDKAGMISFMDEYYDRFPEIRVKHPSSAHEIFYVRILDFRVPASLVMSENNALTKILMKALSKALGKVLPSSTVRRWVVPMETPMLHRSIRDFSDIIIGDAIKNIDTLLSKFGWVFGEELSMISSMSKAKLFYEQGDLEEANIHATKAVAEVRSHFPVELVFCAYAIFISVLDALDKKDSEDAKIALESISTIINSKKACHLAHNFSAFIIRRKMVDGDTKVAEDWLSEKIYDTPTLYRMYSDITTCRALIVTGKYDSAIILLHKTLKIAYDFNRPLDIIETQILLAVAYWKKKRGFQNKALEHLEEAVWVAYPYGVVQIFANDGAELAGILHKLINRVKQRESDSNKPLSFVKLLYLKADIKNKKIDKSVENTVKYTAKQLAIMNLFCNGKTYKEMAEALGIKQTTLRTHLESIYSKLEVTNMSDAIAKIDAMGLLK